MTDYKDRAQEILAENVQRVLEHGPGMYRNQQTAFIAKCSTGKHVLQTGLGCMGVGTVWAASLHYDGALKDHHTAEIEEVWKSLPVESCGEAVCGGDVEDKQKLVLANVLAEALLK